MPDGKSLVITGGIGTGKSTVSDFLGTLGWSVADADQIGHAVLTTPDVVVQVEGEWPDVVMDHQVDRKRLGRLVFADPAGLARLEAITHPLIQEQLDRWLDVTAGPKAVEVSVLRVRKVAWGPVVVVDAPESLRIERAIWRGLSRSEISARLSAQPGRQEWLQLADFVVPNSGSLADLERAVRRLSGHVLSQ